MRVIPCHFLHGASFLGSGALLRERGEEREEKRERRREREQELLVRQFAYLCMQMVSNVCKCVHAFRKLLCALAKIYQ